MKLLLSIIIVFAGTSLYAQNFDGYEKPDFNLIEKNIKDVNSPYHFDKLYERFTTADTTMTTEEKRHLYFGYSFQEEYAPYERSERQGDLNEILKKNELNNEDYESIISLTNEILQIYPFSIRMKEYRIFSFNELERFKEAEKETTQATIILDAILSTGDGTSIENSFYVINTMNEYELINILGFEFGGKQELIEHQYDYLTLNENSYNLEGLYFEVSRCLDSIKF